MDKRKLLQRLLPVVSSTSWDRLEDYLTFERSELVDMLVTSNDIKTINRVQGKIIFIDQILSLPEELKKV